MRNNLEVLNKTYKSTFKRFRGEIKDGESEKEEESNRRHIFIFFDGTWNEDRDKSGAATPTNVLRMYQELLVANNNYDISHDIIKAHYYRGIGSRQDNSKPRQLWYGFSGKDEERIRRSAFADLYRDLRSKNDRIYILGFSRGAASARLLARDICLKGLPEELNVKVKHYPNLLTGQIEARMEKAYSNENWVGETLNVAFLGCWDTVDAFIVPSRFPQHQFLGRWKKRFKRIFKFPVLPVFKKYERFHKDKFGDGHEMEIPNEVEKAVHCVAIDETRNAFLPTLMPKADNVEEVWFPGVHGDIGGGYIESGLSEAPYQFMKKRLMNSVGPDIEDLFERNGKKKVRDEKIKPKNDKINKASKRYCFHFHGLNTGIKTTKGLIGFGTRMRKIRVLDYPDLEQSISSKILSIMRSRELNKTVKPKIHCSINTITSSDSVFAANKKNKSTWQIFYDPYNVKELKESYLIVDESGKKVSC